MDKISVKGEKPGQPGSGEIIIEEIKNPLEEINIDFYTPKAVLYLNEMVNKNPEFKDKTWPTYAIAYEIPYQKKPNETEYVVTHEPMPGLLNALEIYPYRLRERKTVVILRFIKDTKDPEPIYSWDYQKGGWKRIPK